MNKKTKIIATLGPAVDSDESLREMFELGVNIVRLNFSHGTHEEHSERIARVKRVREEVDLPIAIMLDTKGPEIRTGLLAEGTVQLQKGQEFTLTPDDVEGSSERVHQTYPELCKYVKPGTDILIDDGLIELQVVKVEGRDIVCEVLNSGELGEHKSINIPGVDVGFPLITEQDKDDLLFGIEQDIDFVAASFVRNGESVRAIRKFLAKNGNVSISIIAKVENARAVECIDDIIAAADGVMIARGDLGVEMPAQEVPHLQKRIAALCNMAHKPVITATQMLESMTHSPRPTRAEAADVANAIYDGSDCVMLSGETAKGEYPIQAVHTMVDIIETTEVHFFADERKPAISDNPFKTVSQAVGTAAVETAVDIKAKCLVCPTMTGRTARLMSSLRSYIPIYAVTPDAHIQRSMQIFWGVKPILGDVQGDMRRVIDQAKATVVDAGLVSIGDVCVITCGDRFTSPVSRDENGHLDKFAPTNVMYVVQIRSEEFENTFIDSEDALMTRAFFHLKKTGKK